MRAPGAAENMTTKLEATLHNRGVIHQWGSGSAQKQVALKLEVICEVRHMGE
jgi:hypothetical protein